MTRQRAVVCGVDEAGRGPIAGPVYAAAVVLDPAHPIRGLKDSKLLAAARREVLSEAIRERARAWHVAWASVEEIDRLNILQATLLAMQRAVEGLGVQPEETLVDGNRLPTLSCPARCIVGGDRLHRAISAASILAKTARDAEMCRLHARFPQYGFDQHKGYATREHLDNLERFGACEIHRRSFEPVRRVVQPGLW
ncbi:MAG: ribonuclease HII [Betaproteobacteria bacterium]|nr:ribonuclease HII [Betaproteobacteria bacterium]